MVYWSCQQIHRRNHNDSLYQRNADSIPSLADPTPAPSTGFLPAKGYWTVGDNDARIGRLATFMRNNFPFYTPASALGNYYGKYIAGAIKEFQRRTGLQADGTIAVADFDYEAFVTWELDGNLEEIIDIIGEYADMDAEIAI